MAANNNTEKKSDKAVKNAAAPATEKKGVVGWFKNLGIKIGKAFYNMYHELKKVTWPTKSGLINYSVVVMVFLVIMGVIIGVFDLGAAALVSLITG